jgi:hypothetical protein
MVSTKTDLCLVGRDALAKGEPCPLFNGRDQAAPELLGEDITVPENARNHSTQRQSIL